MSVGERAAAIVWEGLSESSECGRARKDSDVRELRSPSIVVRAADNAGEAEKLLPMAVLGRLCSEANPSTVRQDSVYLSNVIVALDRDSPVGFVAYRRTPAAIRVAHECWVDPHARCGLAPVIGALLTALEDAAKTAGCSRLFVVVAQSTPLRRIFASSGYSISFVGGDLKWFEKGLVDDRPPLDSA
jgi:hypothetical protein